MLQDMQTFFKFVFLIILLLGAPQIAMSLGIKSASIVNSRARGILKSGRKWAGRKIARKPAELAARGTGSTVKTTGRVLQKLGFGKFGRGIEARGTLLRQKPMGTKEAEAYKRRFEALSPMAQEKELIAQKRGAFALIGTQSMLKNGNLLKTENKEVIQKGTNQLRAYGLTKVAEEIEEMRPGKEGEMFLKRAMDILGADKVAKSFDSWNNKIGSGSEGNETRKIIIDKLERIHR